ncbi:PRC-barrel domain-containing protein [Zunongwangia atlantica]|uniref:PRC-barrel domain-containing protein n=1 Tax=Zunongwangia atlantica 22II14-10F7 TaxID=1185767 RepID=A0A1Y1T3H6_9FLAO|nr:PRC-barrel domain-containing protein [Zunongwangia atlantica]ORL45587.1 hypothetical protein IIF7_10258 [Zunongwangia atlantica 22II14-10F7]
MKTKEKHLYSLNELGDYKIAKNDHDIRGWEVRDRDAKSIGRVDNLLANKDLGKVVYVDVEVHQSIIDKNHDPFSANNDSGFKEFINKDGENHIIIPIGLIYIHPEEKYVHTNSLDYNTFAETKRYRTGEPISRNYEEQILSSYKANYRPNEIKGKHDSLKEDEYIESEYSARKSSPSPAYTSYPERETTQDRIERERANLKYKSEVRHDREETTEERMERERAHLRATSGHPDPAFKPARTYDDDKNWVREKEYLSDAEIEARRKGRIRNDEDFYNQEEFRPRRRY